MKKVVRHRSFLKRLHTNERGEAADLLVKAALLCILWYACIGVYDWIQEVKQERIQASEEFRNPTQKVKRPPGF